MAIVIVVVVIVVVVLVVGLLAARRRRLRQHFGPEYDRLVGERGGRRAAEAELARRERRVHGLDIRPLADDAQAEYSGQWVAVQERFVDAPADAVAAAQALVTALMRDRGYPTEDHDQIVADLSVRHAATIDHYRQASEISGNAASGAASTEDLRIAMIHYRALFRDLLGERAEPAGTEPAGTEPAAGVEPTDTEAGSEPAGAQPAGAEPTGAKRPGERQRPAGPSPAAGTATDRRANGSVDRMPRELSGPVVL
jgi:hypothetical protein